MRKMLFLLVLLPALGFAQSGEDVTAFLSSIPNHIGRSVPALDGKKNNRLYSVRELGLQRHYFYSIASEKEYRLVFGFYLPDSLPVIDFSKQELLVYAACGQCMIVCHHRGSGNEPCHRNACTFQQAWYVREKKLKLIAGN